MFPLAQASPASHRLASLSQWQWSGLIFFLTLAVHFTFYRLTGADRTFDFAEMENLARNLAQQNVLGNPYFLPTGPSAHHVPIYPFLLSLIFRFFGYGPDARAIQAFMNIVFVAAQMSLLPLLARIANLPLRIGVAAGLVAALLPARVLKETRFESCLSGLAAVLFVIVLVNWLQTTKPSARHSLLAGLMTGVCVMATPPLLLVTLALLVFWFFRRPRLQVCLLAVAFFVALVPWTVRNYIQLRGFVPLRSNFQLEEALSNNDDAVASAVVNFQHPNFRHPALHRSEALRVQQLGEIQYNRVRGNEARAWILSHPKRFLSLTATRFLYFWFPAYPLHQIYKCLLDYPITILGFVGLFHMLQRRLPIGEIFAFIMIFFPPVYYLVEADTRYRYPIDWALLFLASYALLRSVAWLPRALAPPQLSQAN